MTTREEHYSTVYRGDRVGIRVRWVEGGVEYVSEHFAHTPSGEPGEVYQPHCRYVEGPCELGYVGVLVDRGSVHAE